MSLELDFILGTSILAIVAIALAYIWHPDKRRLDSLETWFKSGPHTRVVLSDEPELHAGLPGIDGRGESFRAMLDKAVRTLREGK